MVDVVALRGAGRSATSLLLWWWWDYPAIVRVVQDSIVYLHKEEKVRRWIGIGPGKVGRNLVGKEVGMKGGDTKGGGVWGISDPREVETVLKELDMTETMNEED